MIPKIIHYIWLGGNEMPELVQRCISAWRAHMPEGEWTYRLWTESTIADYCAQNNLQSPLTNNQYCREAFSTRKYAFVSDYIRLWVLEREGGVYLDTDVEVIRSFNNLPEFTHTNTITNTNTIPIPTTAFIGFEESLAHLPGTCVMGCEPHCQWVKDMLATYDGAQFIKDDGSFDLTTNVQRLGKAMIELYGLVPNGKEQLLSINDKRINAERKNSFLHIYDHHHFSPITSTRVMRKTKNTFCFHHFAGSWTEQKSLLGKLRNHPWMCEVINVFVQLKRLVLRKH